MTCAEVICRLAVRLSKNHSDKRFPVYDELIFKIYTVCVSISCIALSGFSFIPPVYSASFMLMQTTPKIRYLFDVVHDTVQ